MFGIEYLEMSQQEDRLDIAYDLADTAGIATGGSGADKFFLSIDLNGGNDVLKIGDDLPAVKGASKNWGALVDGGTGNDKINGGQLNDQLAGGEGNDFVRGGGGDDILNGVNGNDTIYGEDGNDRITLDGFYSRGE